MSTRTRHVRPGLAILLTRKNLRGSIAGLCVLAIALLNPAECLAWGKLDRIAQETRTPSPAPPENGDSNSHDDDDDHHSHSYGHAHHDDDDFETELTLAMLYATGVVVSSPIWMPPKLIGDDTSITGYFAHHPYYEHVPGYLMLEYDMPSKPRAWTGRTRLEYGTDFDDIDRVGGQILVSHSSRLGIDAEWNSFAEKTATGTDRLTLGDINLVYRIAQSERLLWRAGIGLNWLDDEVDTEYGINFTYGADWFPCEPLVVSSTLDWGRLSETSRFHIRSTLGVVVHGWELYAGYDYETIGGVDLYGPVAGVRFWF